MTDFIARYGPWALITGASSGLGAEYARQLSAKGLNVVLVARRQDRLEALADEIGAAHPVQTRVLVSDLSADGACETVVEQVRDLEIGLLVNNAGFGRLGRYDELQPQELAQMTVLNCVVPVLLTNLLLPPMVARQRGGLIFLASLAAYQSCPYFTVYAATKVFNLFMGEGLYGEYRALGIDSLAVSPGVTQTEFTAQAGMSSGAGPRLATADSVVADSLRHLGRRPSFVHGFINKVAALASRFLPRRLVLWMSGFALRQRMGG